jgi:endoglucanase
MRGPGLSSAVSVLLVLLPGAHVGCADGPATVVLPAGSSSGGAASGSSSSGSSGHSSSSSGAGSSSSSGGSAGSSSSSGGTGTTAAGYTVTGPFVFDATGAKHVFRGVARPSLEWSATGDNLQQSDYDTMKAWGANVVRLSLNQDFWIVDPSNPHAVSYYADFVDSQVQAAEADSIDVILDLHWSDGGSFNNSPGQWCMADQNSLTFWTQVATKYKSDPHVLFELYNEPYVTDWNLWLNGGTTSCTSNQTNAGVRMSFSSTFAVAGMQQLYNAVRATGARNLVIAGGINYAFDLSGVGQGSRLKDANGNPAANVMYNTHPYNQSGKTTPAQWYTAFGYLAATDPVIATEFGDATTASCGTATYDQSLMAYFDAQGASSNPANRISWTAWAFYVGGCAFPSLLTDWTTYATTVPGAAVEASLKAFRQ